ncbi:MAG: SRPBCC family protein [Bacteroidetes bacterium]|jgi:carbon monoxide dehydrogenase subunit G|nr:SRPBCC family protein [Bacteroidota bacterium]MBT3748258.1 SRPBCC family protein [Bacteroidota bacterium]MBT4400192.1 SRPBCC family protein [Bacteroidota bacterium]MBT4408775.1 SRPBCC family protein [Bacteroidota bacterium]MBT5426150.1 SRPBCC family protein [Bacteroidota bacterium]
MTDIVSKQGKIAGSDEDIYSFLTDLRNLDSYIPSDKINDWQSDENSCSFSIPQAGTISLQITDKEPNTLIKVEPQGNTPFGFKFFIQIKEVAEQDTRFKLTLRAELNAMMKTMFKGQIQKGLDQIVDTLSGMKIPSSPE